MPKTAGEINAPFACAGPRVGRVEKASPFPLETRRFHDQIEGMNYILAILIPPLSILLTGRPFLAVIVFLIWVPALVFSGGLTHPMFILLAWALIFHAREDRRERF